MHNIGNNGINANFVLPYLQFSSLFAPDEVCKCEIQYQWVLELCILKLPSSLILFISNDRAKTMPFLYCG